MRTVPFFVWPAAILIAELALQLSPYTGVFLMMLGAPFWSVLLINTTLVLLAVDAWRRTVPRWVLAVPVALYGAYFVAYSVSYVEYLQLDRQIAQANAVGTIAYDPAQHDILIDYGPEPPKRIPSIAHVMTSKFNLLAAYEVDPRKTPASSVHKLSGRAQCDSLRATAGTVSGFHVDDVFIKNACIASLDEVPRRATVVLRPEPDVYIYGWVMKAAVKPLGITDPSGSRKRVAAGTAQVLSPLPSPIIGCTLISSKPAWECFAYFERTRRSVGGDHSPLHDGRSEAAARALEIDARRVVKATSRGVLGTRSGEIDPRELPNT